MKRASIRARRRLADGHRLIQVVCPRCDHRHWMPEAAAGFCSRHHATFTVTERTPT
jgi:hypothetical protein